MIHTCPTNTYRTDKERSDDKPRICGAPAASHARGGQVQGGHGPGAHRHDVRARGQLRDRLARRVGKPREVPKVAPRLGRAASCARRFSLCASARRRSTSRRGSASSALHPRARAALHAGRSGLCALVACLRGKMPPFKLTRPGLPRRTAPCLPTGPSGSLQGVLYIQGSDFALHGPHSTQSFAWGLLSSMVSTAQRQKVMCLEIRS